MAATGATEVKLGIGLTRTVTSSDLEHPEAVVVVIV